LCDEKKLIREDLMPNAILVSLFSLIVSACAAPTPQPQPPTAAPAATVPAPTAAPPTKAAQPTGAATLPTITSTQSGQVNTPGNVPSVVPACPSDVNTPLLTMLPIDPKDFMAFRPLGFQSPPIHMFPAKHSAFSMTKPGDKPVAKPFKSPGKMWVVEIWEASFSTGGKNYQVFTFPCNQVRIYWGHFAAVSEKLIAEFKKGEPKCNSFADGTGTVTTCRREGLAISLEAGEEFASGPDSAGVDLGVIDFRLKPAAFINLEHYDFYYPYYASPINYFTPEVKKVLESKTGNVFGTKMRTAQPVGGTYMQDLVGTAQGNWFTGGKYHRTATDLAPFLGLVHDYTDPAQPMMAIGNSVKGMAMGLYSFTPQSAGKINRDFSDVKADGNIYCYDNFLQGQSTGGMPLARANGILLMSLTSETNLKLEFVNGGKCNANAKYEFTANATVFER
jgi:hypothetical protein